MEKITINCAGNKFLNMHSYENSINVGYLPTFNYLDGNVDFNRSEINTSNFDLGYAYTPPLTHFNGFSVCEASFGVPDGATGGVSGNALLRNLCRIKTKYISISGTSLSIVYKVPPSVGKWESTGHSQEAYMVNGSISNVKYFITGAVDDESVNTGLGASYKFLGDRTLVGDIFPMYFPKRDTLVLKGDKLDRG